MRKAKLGPRVAIRHDVGTFESRRGASLADVVVGITKYGWEFFGET